eukprot:5405179-Prymnesium_polylepis.1
MDARPRWPARTGPPRCAHTANTVYSARTATRTGLRTSRAPLVHALRTAPDAARAPFVRRPRTARTPPSRRPRAARAPPTPRARRPRG